MTVTKMERVVLDKALAVRLIEESRAHNRGLTRAVVDRYARDMRDGRWLETGDAIRVGPDGMIDGQHRCHAVVASGVPIVTWLATVDRTELYDVIDSGNVRDRGDTLSAYTGAYTATASLVSAVYAIECRSYSIGAAGAQAYGRPTNSATRARYLSNRPRFDAAIVAAKDVSRLRGAGTLGPSLSWYVHGDAVDAFLRGVANGENLRRGDPALAIRNRILTSTRAPTPTKLAWWLRAAGAAAGGADLMRCQTPESFPYPEPSEWIRYTR